MNQAVELAPESASPVDRMIEIMDKQDNPQMEVEQVQDSENVSDSEQSELSQHVDESEINENDESIEHDEDDAQDEESNDQEHEESEDSEESELSEGESNVDDWDNEIEFPDGNVMSAKEIRNQMMTKADYTRKTQEIAKEREEVAQVRTQYTEKSESLDSLGEFHVNSLQVLDQLLDHEVNQFNSINWQELARTNPAEYAVKTEQRNQAFAKRQQIREQANRASQMAQEKKAQELNERAISCRNTLNEKLPGGFTLEKYDALRKKGVELGMSQQYVDELVEPGVFLMLNELLERKEVAKKAIKKLSKKAPGKTISARKSRRANKVKKISALDKVSKTGRMKDAEEAWKEIFSKS